ncbi:hypothetical protein CPB83DRAFT_842085 [Crepidotus variabilis]|uniref:Uncharacterized protein n=1 Tax=Crepidotus variabilis TaxID=179855 RepID=A0A9P6EUK1_9AGAR|nr:hypothetical protein CPB83DRAFT_842085 [Crepidotus variabilis]
MMLKTTIWKPCLEEAEATMTMTTILQLLLVVEMAIILLLVTMLFSKSEMKTMMKMMQRSGKLLIVYLEKIIETTATSVKA